MNYHHNPNLAARMVHMLYCPAGQAAVPEEIAHRMGIPISDGNGDRILEEVGRRVLADPEDIPDFVATLSKLMSK